MFRDDILQIHMFRDDILKVEGLDGNRLFEFNDSL